MKEEKSILVRELRIYAIISRMSEMREERKVQIPLLTKLITITDPYKDFRELECEIQKNGKEKRRDRRKKERKGNK